MKKVFYMFLAIVAMIVMSACGTKSTTNEKTDVTDSTTIVTDSTTTDTIVEPVK